MLWQAQACVHELCTWLQACMHLLHLAGAHVVAVILSANWLETLIWMLKAQLVRQIAALHVLTSRNVHRSVTIATPMRVRCEQHSLVNTTLRYSTQVLCNT